MSGLGSYKKLHRQETAHLISAFEGDYYIDEMAVEDGVKHTSMFNVIHLASMMKIDFIVKEQTPYRQTEFERRRKVDLDGDSIWFVAPEDLILSKLLWASDSRSEIQLNDVRNLLRALTSLDRGYLEHWANVLTISELLAEVRS